jgi:hypothetical protein
MALTTKQLLNYAWMSQAAYLDFTGLSNGASGVSLEARLKSSPALNKDKILADEQSKAFTGSSTAVCRRGKSYHDRHFCD